MIETAEQYFDRIACAEDAKPADWASQAAWEIVNEFLGAEPMTDEETSDFLQKKQDAIAAALRAERERCAAVADAWAADGDWDKDCCRGIAAQIRDPESAEPQL
jgi:hypothetical protein